MQIDHVSKAFLHVQNNYHNGFIFQMFFWKYQMCTISFKIEENLNIDDYKSKGT